MNIFLISLWTDENPKDRFQKERQSVSLFLKSGMEAFCFRHLVFGELVLTKVSVASGTMLNDKLLTLNTSTNTMTQNHNKTECKWKIISPKERI